MCRSFLVITVLALGLSIVFTPVHAAGWTAQATTLDLIAGPGNTAAFLAPDGSRFAYLNNRELCLYSLSGEKRDCIALDRDIHVNPETLRWSPDSTKLAFSEDFIYSFRDSDIWLYDTETNALTDVTPAPNRDVSILANKDPAVSFTIDMVPQWSADSQSVYFIRYQFQKTSDARAVFMRLNINSGELEELAAVKSNAAVSTYGYGLSSDDSLIAYNLDTRGREKDGTWYLDTETNEAKFAAAFVQGTSAWTYQFSPDGEYVLVVGMDLVSGVGPRKPETSPIYTVPVFGGRQQNVNKDTYVFAAGWGQQDTMLAYTTFFQENSDKEGLYITNKPGETGDLVLPGRFISPTPRNLVPLVWAANDTILLSHSPEFKLTVVQLKQS